MTDPNPYAPPAASVAEAEAPVPLDRATPAGLWVRGLAFFLDYAPLYVPTTLNLLVWKSVAVAVAVVLVFPAYKIFMEGTYGATLGKMILSIRVVDARGGIPGVRRAALRFAPWLPTTLVGLVASILLLSDPEYFATTSLVALAAYKTPLVKWTLPAGALRWVDTLVLLTNERKRTIHDSMAGTYCVHVPRRGRGG